VTVIPSGFYDRSGAQIPQEKYDELKAIGSNYFLIEETHLNEDVVVSTVWSGLDHWNDPPQIFWTRVFHLKFTVNYDQFTRSYATEQAARTGHVEVTDAVEKFITREED
jgi:hypothetical protein